MPEVKCTYCGKILSKPANEIRKSTTGRFFCNKEEKLLWNKENDAYRMAQKALKKTRYGGPALVYKEVVYG